MSRGKYKLFTFPRFLLPSFPQNRRATSATEHDLGPSSKCLNGHISYLQCTGCSAHLCFTSQIISKGFTGRHGRAYLVSAEPVATAVSINSSSSPTASLPNTTLHHPVPRQLVTGAHTVSDISCATCGSVLGWKYVAAEEDSQRYKVGKFILETQKITTSSSWDGNPEANVSAGQLPAPDFKTGPKDIEFDSQDEDECEDLFAGIWSPGLAIRRRERKAEHRPAMFGLS